jgi:hypothetical protein
MRQRTDHRPSNWKHIIHASDPRPPHHVGARRFRVLNASGMDSNSTPQVRPLVPPSTKHNRKDMSRVRSCDGKSINRRRLDIALHSLDSIITRSAPFIIFNITINRIIHMACTLHPSGTLVFFPSPPSPLARPNHVYSTHKKSFIISLAVLYIHSQIQREEAEKKNKQTRKSIPSGRGVRPPRRSAICTVVRSFVRPIMSMRLRGSS